MSVTESQPESTEQRTMLNGIEGRRTDGQVPHHESPKHYQIGNGSECYKKYKLKGVTQEIVKENLIMKSQPPCRPQGRVTARG